MRFIRLKRAQPGDPSPMNGTPHFDKLVFSAERIARHSQYPGKEQVIDLCLADAEELMLAAKITAEQRDVLRGILLGTASQAA